MAKAQIDTTSLEVRITALAEAFARDVVAVISSASMEELIRLGAVAQSGGLRITAPLIGRTTLITPIKRKRSWPICGEPDCGAAYYPASGTARLCYKHFLATGGKHPSKRK